MWLQLGAVWLFIRLLKNHHHLVESKSSIDVGKDTSKTA
jgi:hypothetical protein